MMRKVAHPSSWEARAFSYGRVLPPGVKALTSISQEEGSRAEQNLFNRNKFRKIPSVFHGEDYSVRLKLYIPIRTPGLVVVREDQHEDYEERMDCSTTYVIYAETLKKVDKLARRLGFHCREKALLEE